MQEIDEVVSTLMGAMLARLEADAWCLSLVQELVEVAIDSSNSDSPPSQLLQQRLSTHALTAGSTSTSTTTTAADAVAELQCEAMYSAVLHALGYSWSASTISAAAAAATAATAAAAAVFDLSSAAGCISSDSDSDSDFGASLLHQSDSPPATVDTAVGAWGTEHWSLIAAEVFVARARAQRGAAARHCRVATLAAMAAAEPELLQQLTVRSSTAASSSSSSSGGSSISSSGSASASAVAGIGARQQRARQRSGSIEVRYRILKLYP
jgi:hypothetical protein